MIEPEPVENAEGQPAKRSLRLQWKSLITEELKPQPSPSNDHPVEEDFDWDAISPVGDISDTDEDYIVPNFAPDTEEKKIDISDGEAESGPTTVKHKRKTRIRNSKGNLKQPRKRVETNPNSLIEVDTLCTLCGKDFKNPSHLKDHQTSHLENPGLFVCPQCGQEFKYERNLRRHLKIHTGSKNHVCQTCQREFMRNADLRRHEKTHSGEKLFLCEICSKTFTRPLSLIQHRRTHTGEYPYACARCPKAYTTKSALDYHLTKHHKPKVKTDGVGAETAINDSQSTLDASHFLKTS